uniref:Secreted protein n=1 Tax=Bursaphelenchus xylophilus TaxID=6326 RepID=A0A1I7SQC6_BURXY
MHLWLLFFCWRRGNSTGVGPFMPWGTSFFRSRKRPPRVRIVLGGMKDGADRTLLTGPLPGQAQRAWLHGKVDVIRPGPPKSGSLSICG